MIRHETFLVLDSHILYLIIFSFNNSTKVKLFFYINFEIIWLISIIIIPGIKIYYLVFFKIVEMRVCNARQYI